MELLLIFKWKKFDIIFVDDDLNPETIKLISGTFIKFIHHCYQKNYIFTLAIMILTMVLNVIEYVRENETFIKLKGKLLFFFIFAF